MLPPTMVLPFAQSNAGCEKYTHCGDCCFRHNYLDESSRSCLISLSHTTRISDLPEFSTRLPMRRSTANHATRTPSHVFCTYIADKHTGFHCFPAGRQSNGINR